MPQPRTKLRPPEIAQRFGVDVKKVLAWIHSGELRAINAAEKADGDKPRFLVDVADLEEFERRRAVVPAPKVKRQKKRRFKQFV